MPFLVTGGSTEFTPSPAGQWQGVCCDVVDLGMLTNKFGQTKHMVQLRWQISERMETGKRFLTTRRFNATLHPQGALRPFLEAWRGKAFEEKDVQPPGFDLERLIGANAFISIIHEKNGEQTYANVNTIMPWRKEFGEPMEVEDYVRVQDRPETAEANEQKQAAGTGGKGDFNKALADATKPDTEAATGAAGDNELSDDEIPF